MTKPQTIVLVDDEPGIVFSFGEVLRHHGYEVFGCSEVGEAQARIQENEPDLVITDISMPGATGTDLLTWMTDHRSSVPVILMTGQPTVETAALGVRKRAFDYLAKPISADLLLSTVDRVLLATLAQVRTSRDKSGIGVHIRSEEITDALDSGEIQVYFQPKARCSDLKLTGAEALLRWFRKDGSSVSPAALVAAAEEEGLILQLGEWVLRTVFKQLSIWLESGIDLVPIAVNVSPLQFTEGNILQVLDKLKEENPQAPLHLINLEITETVVMENIGAAQEILNALRQTGVSISLDDFGTGYSSLSYLTLFPIQYLKIDRSFITNLGADSPETHITRTIIQLAQILGLRVIAEGVETAAQLENLRDFDCDEIQGYLVSEAVPVTQMHGMLLNGQLRGSERDYENPVGPAVDLLDTMENFVRLVVDRKGRTMLRNCYG